jgi:hypothetical protein
LQRLLVAASANDSHLEYGRMRSEVSLMSAMLKFAALLVFAATCVAQENRTMDRGAEPAGPSMRGWSRAMRSAPRSTLRP